MARGMANNEPVVSQAQTREFDENYERIYGSERKPQRGRWIWDEVQQKLVRAEEYVPPPSKTGTGIMVDRFYEGVKTLDGKHDIGSRRKRRAFMREHGLTDMSDFSEAYLKKIREDRDRANSKTIREGIERKFYELQKP